MYKEELQEQITRCREMQSKCRIDDIDTFIRLSNRIEELTGKIDKTEKQSVCTSAMQGNFGSGNVLELNAQSES